MTAQLRKEARALLPYWAGTLATIVTPYLLGGDWVQLSWFAYAFGCALLGGMSFGQEFQHRTLTMLLSQPLARAVIWRDKMLVLAAALLTSTAFLVGVSAAAGTPSFFDERFLPFIPLCIFCGAPLLTLLSGSALGGGILSLTIPGCWLTLAMIVRLFFPALSEGAIALPLVLLSCAVTVVLGYARFQTYEARDVRSSNLGIPGWLLPRPSSTPGSPLATLLRKELHLQHGAIVLAVVIGFFLFLGGVLSQAGRGDLGKIAEVAIGIDLLVLPLVAGAIAIGEERSLGVAEWQLSLPPSARQQWLAKMLVTLPLSLVLGLVVPLLVWRPVPGIQTLVALVVVHLLLIHLGLYAGSLSRGTMPAILLALALAVGTVGFYAGLLAKLEATPNAAIGLALLPVLLQYFAFSNYRQREPRLGRIGLQGLAVSGLLVASVVFLGV